MQVDPEVGRIYECEKFAAMFYGSNAEPQTNYSRD